MFLATAIVSVLLAAALLGSAAAKFTRNPQVMDTMTTVGVPADRVPILGALEVAGAVGLVAGLAVWPLGVAAAIGTILYFVGAVGSHLRVDDRQIQGATVLLVVAVAALVLRLVTA